MIPCNYCGSFDQAIIFQAGEAQISQIVRCNQCGLMFTSPRAKEPDHIEIANYDPEFNPLHKDDTRVIKEQLQVRDYKSTRDMLNNFFPRRGKLLEVGSSLGYLLNTFREDGWNVRGLEPFYQCCRYARESFGLDITQGTLDSICYRDGQFDVILLNHVIEHLDNPLETLCKINRLLKVGGYFVIETPRYDTLMFKIFGRNERSIRCNGHIYFFTTETLKNLYERAGFRTITLDYVGRSLTYERLIYNIGIIFQNRWIQYLLNRLPIDKKTSFYLNLWDMQRACVQKVRTVNFH